ncbi:MAG TPA: tannase/feruloyl esterase family alpha/beta hydrolase [Gammaproteobacteria bacterium]|nr:tannase/feruloyl esterase family alpha/beta hydrolase [Gammaproteobacteria bacterium]
MKRTTISLAVAVAAGTLAAAGNASAAGCADLAKLSLQDTKITVAESIKSFTPPGSGAPGAPAPQALKIPSICRVAGVVSPAIKFEVWLPETAAWNGRFQAVGGGGLAGVISYGALAEAVNAGYASASTDTGHESTDSKWLDDRQRIIDYGYRAIHEMTVKAKAVIDSFYGKAPEYSYFNGCSTGGRQGLMEAQRFPDDYNGIISGAPVNTFTHLHMGQLWTAHATLKTPGAALTRDDLTLVSKAVLEQCDAADGVKDGVLLDPRTCHFQPKTLECNGSQTQSCLAPAKVHALEMIYAGAKNPRTGVQIYPGLEPGGEGPQPGNPGWGMIMNGQGPFNIDTAVLGGMAFRNPQWDWRTFDFDKDVTIVDNKLYGVLNAVDPDLRDFKNHGGKLVIYHGWADPGVMPQRTVDFYQEMIDFAAKAHGGDGVAYTNDFTRLYMVPGMGHCRGGNGPDQSDWMSVISGWVEHNKAPTSVVASSVRDGKVVTTRPLCPHPQVARYKGKGDTNDAANFECAAPK